jgi:peptide deformylase
MDVLRHPNPSLKQRALPVDLSQERDLKTLCVNMGRAMYDGPGIGLAAPQIGILKRVIVYDLDDEKPSLVALLNPEIVQSSDELEIEDEGCLSFPGVSIPIERAAFVVCDALTLSGKPVRIEAEGLHARLLQHEIDHLDGVLIIDRATAEERKEALKRYREAVERGAGPEGTSI